MHLVTFEDCGSTAIGVLNNEPLSPRIVDLRRLLPDFPTDMLQLLQSGDKALDRLRAALHSVPESCWIDLASVALRAPILRPGKIICVGHNYHDHAGLPAGDLPEFPTFFSKFSTAVIGSGQDIVLPKVSSKVDNEAELAVVIGRRGRHIAQSQAMTHVAGYTILNDVSARDYQKRTTQWMMGKTFDTFAPMGPALVTADAIADVNNLALALSVNDVQMQASSTRHFIFPIAFLISYLSEVMTLEPGDIISTGTPSRLGQYREQPVYMQPGDEVRIRIEGIGELVNRFVAE
jgi:acylpyruvate hydrolase